jgi:cytochrome c-type biogenesis protein CcmH/NrfG
VKWIEREPANPRPYYHLAQFYRMENRTEQALGLLLEAVRLDPRSPTPTPRSPSVRS